MFYERNHVLIGLVIGICMPIIGYALILTLLEQIDNVSSSNLQLATALKTRTLALIAICINIFLMRYYRRLRAEESMRGVFIAVGICAIAWIAKFSGEIFNF
jgi:uncharacterized BrkB/YihY/UPF0761 family membrane protein